MRTRHAAFTVLLPVLFLGAAGCSKKDAAQDSTSATPSAAPSAATSAASSAAGCADKLASFKANSSADDKKAYALACGAVSPKAQSCIAGVKAESEMDACLADKADKDAFMGAILLAAAKAGGAAASGPRTAKLDKLGLQIDVPGEPSIGDGTSKGSVMVNTVAFGQVIVAPAGPTTAKTLKAAKAAAKTFKPTNLQGEQASDSYWMTFQATSLYWVKTLRQVGKTSYTCETAVDSADKAAAALTACKSIRS